MKYISVLLVMIILPLIALITFFILPINIQAATNTTVIEVNISEVSQIGISPGNISWSQVVPGSNGSVQTVTIENIGSTTFTNGMYVSVDSMINYTNNPTAGDAADKYMAGTFLVAGNSSTLANDVWWFVNSILWNESTYPAGMTGASSEADMWGYYHNKSQSYLFELNKSDDGTCRNCSDAYLKIVQTVGSKDLTSTYSAVCSSNNTEWGLWDFESGPLQNYCVVAHTSCNFLMIYKFDLNATISSCGNDTYILPGSFAPGASKDFYVKPHVPSGTPAGTATNSTVTVTAS